MKSQLGKEFNGFSEEQRQMIYENLFAIELTDGCSIGCDFCGLDAKKGINSKIPFNVLEQISEEMSTLTDRLTEKPLFASWNPKVLCLYSATEPLDYTYDEKDYFHARELFASRGFTVPTITAVPAGKEELAITNLDNIERISLSHMNKKRLMPYFKGLGVVVYIDLPSYYHKKYGSGWWEKAPKDFYNTEVVSTVEKEIKRLRKKDPILPKKARFYDVRIDGNQDPEMMQDLETLFLWCGDNGEYPREGKIVDRDEGGLRPYGRAFDLGPHATVNGYIKGKVEYDEGPFYRTSGVKITPEGVFNTRAVRRSEEFRTGVLIERVYSNDFKVLKLTNRDVSRIQMIEDSDYYM